MRVIRAFYLVAGIGLGVLGIWMPALSFEFALLLTVLAVVGAVVRFAAKMIDRYEAQVREGVREAVRHFTDQHPLATMAFAFAAAFAFLGISSAVEPLWDQRAKGGVSWFPLELAGGLVAVGLLGLVVKWLIEYEWRERVARLEQRVAELEG